MPEKRKAKIKWCFYPLHMKLWSALVLTFKVKGPCSPQAVGVGPARTEVALMARVVLVESEVEGLLDKGVAFDTVDEAFERVRAPKVLEKGLKELLVKLLIG